MKKSSVLILAALMSVIFLSNFVLAAVPINMPAPQLPAGNYGSFAPLATVVKGLIDGIAATISYTLGGTGFGDISFAKFLMFILVVIVLYAPSKLIVGKNNNGLAFVVSFIISILGIYFLPNDVIAGLLLPYNTLGVVISVIIPLAALTYFLETFAADIPTIRKIGWILTAIAFFGLMTYRLSDTSALGINGVMVFMYVLAIAACIGFFIFDGTIVNWFRMLSVKKIKDRTLYEQIGQLQTQLKSVTTSLGAVAPGSRDEAVLINDMKDIQKKIFNLYSQIGK
jgi:hypothetical protein